MALAIDKRCFCPPDTFTPPCPNSVSYPSENDFTNSSACAACAASCTSSLEASSSPHSKFSKIVPEKRTFFCNTIPTPFLKFSKLYSFTFTSSTKTSPSSASYSRGISCTKLVFPHPVEPIIPIISPGFATKFIPSNTFSLFSL